MTPSSTACVTLADPERGRSRSFRPDIEGLRAVAILTVLAYHAGLPVRGGFVGVDVFFVISGFLITGLLVTELSRTGSISWLRFVGRRIRRLLPAAVLVLVVTSAVSWVVIPGLRRREVGVDIASAAAYVVNWVLARREVDYLASDARPSPVQHFWSLAVEEQFYVVWPLLLIGLVLAARSVGRGPGRREVALVLGVLVAASFGWSVLAAATKPLPAFFTTTTRAWELGVGALLAVWLSGRDRPARPPAWAAALGWGALGVLLVVATALPAGLPWPGAWALLATLPTAALLWVGWMRPRNGPERLLGPGPHGLGGCAVVLALPVALAGAHPRGVDRGLGRRDPSPVGRGGARGGIGPARLAVLATGRGPRSTGVPGSAIGRARCSPAVWRSRRWACSPLSRCCRCAHRSSPHLRAVRCRSGLAGRRRSCTPGRTHRAPWTIRAG